MTDAPGDELAFDSTPAVSGELRRVLAGIRRLIAPNASPYTFTGTCSYIVGEGDVAIIDPGPLDDNHISALLDAVRGERVGHIVVTHTHRDHSPAAAAIKAATGAQIVGAAAYAPTRADEAAGRLDASHDRDYAPDHALADGETIEGPGYALTAIATPGHAANHLCFAFARENALFSGDHVMAWSTTIVAPPDGEMGAYMASLDKLRERDEAIFWPGHGGPVRDPKRYMRGLAHHRRQREAAILARIDAGDETLAAIVARVYATLNPKLVGAASLSTLAHLEDLMRRGMVARQDGRFRRA
jgi:glyoxylase-like metal-dependent hydrolase (beta-lactamase superfamily II)